MKKLAILLALATFLVTPSAAEAKVMYQEKGAIIIPAGQTIDDDLFVAGDSVDINGTVTGDVFVGAGTVNVSGVIKGGLFVGTGDLNLNGATIANSLIAGAGNITIDKDSKIGGSLIAASGNLKNYAPVGRNLIIGAGNVYLDSKVGKEARIGGGNIELGPHSLIAGNLTYALGEDSSKINQDPVSSVAGSVSRYTPPVSTKRDMELAKQNFVRFGRMASRGWLIVSFFGSLILGFILLHLFPKTSHGISNQIMNKFGSSLGTGFLIIVAAIPSLLVLALTVIGLPLAGMLILLLWMELCLAKLAASYALGRFIAIKFNWSKMSTYLTFGFGLAVFYFFRAIPLIGWITSILFTWSGLGAIWLYAKANLKNL